MQLNVLGEELRPCCLEPITGWSRNGSCSFHANDAGMHHVCVKIDAAFLDYSLKHGNDLATANDDFPGLKPGDQWCLCTSRWLEAFNDDSAPQILLASTNIEVLKYIPWAILQQVRSDD